MPNPAAGSAQPSTPHLMTGPKSHSLQEGTSDQNYVHSISNDNNETHASSEYNRKAYGTIPHILRLNDFKNLNQFLDHSEVMPSFLWMSLANFVHRLFSVFTRFFLGYSRQELQNIAAYMKSNRCMRTSVNVKYGNVGQQEGVFLLWRINMS